MNIRKRLQQMACLVLAMSFLVGCGASQAETTLQLTFDGESCTYEGPTTLKAGPVTLIFNNNQSERGAAVNLVRHTGDETIQDMIDTIGEEPSTGYVPSWVEELGTWERVAPGESYTWEGVLEPGIHTMGCAKLTTGLPGWEVWFGGGLTVEE